MSPRALAAVALAAVITFGCFGAVVGIEKAPLPGDRAMTRAVQEPEWLLPVAEVVNLAGDYQYVTLAAVVVAARAALGRGRTRGAEAGFWAAFVTASVMLALDQELKKVFESPRPIPGAGIEVHDTSGSYGFPSGHTFTAMLVFGLGAAVVAMERRRVAGRILAVAATAIAAAGWARIAVGAHWPSDVLGGALLGVAAAAACLLVGVTVERARASSGDAL